MSAHAPNDHHAHSSEGGPAALDPDEPNTPYWLTALGGALFLLVAVFFLATAGDEPEGEGGAQAGQAAPAKEQPPAEEPPSEE